MTTRGFSSVVAVSLAAGLCSHVSGGLGGCGDATAGDCCKANGTPACDDLICCTQVCVQDPFCCEVRWDSPCASQAQDICGDLCSPGPQILSMRFEQITYDSTDTGFVPFSEYGRIEIVYIPDPLILQWFLQVVADVGFGQGWLVQNVPLLGVDILGERYERGRLASEGQNRHAIAFLHRVDQLDGAPLRLLEAGSGLLPRSHTR